MATRVIDDTKLQNIAVAIQGKDSGGTMTVDEMPGRIEAIPTGSPTVSNPALVLWDWEGTKLAEYSAEDALVLTELPAPNTFPAYAAVDHDLLLFQSWNWNLAKIKTWIQNHEGKALDVGAIYTTTDGKNHNYWGNPRLNTEAEINMRKHGKANIGSIAFRGCHSLAHINIPNSVMSIGSTAFQDCFALTHINIPDSVKSIESNAFQRCYSLTHINIPNSVKSIGSTAFQDCFALTHINIPDSVMSIESTAFRGCFALTHINIPNSVMSIGSTAFQDCFALTHINIPDSVKSIESNAFQRCYSLTHINIPNSVKSIGSTAFQGCCSLYDILLESKPTLVNTNAFSSLPAKNIIYVPRTNLSWFVTATNWSTIYTQGYIVAIEDHIPYLESIGFNVDKYKEVTV